MTNIYTDAPDQNANSADATIEYFNKYNQKEIAFKPGDVSAVKGFFIERGMAEPAAEATAFVVLRQCKFENLNPLQILDQLKEVEGISLDSILGDILNINRQVTSTLGVASTAKKKESVDRNILG